MSEPSKEPRAHGKDNRCSNRKHVKENGSTFCDCGKLMLVRTAAKNAIVVTIVDPVQADALARMGVLHA